MMAMCVMMKYKCASASVFKRNWLVTLTDGYAQKQLIQLMSDRMIRFSNQIVFLVQIQVKTVQLTVVNPIKFSVC